LYQQQQFNIRSNNSTTDELLRPTMLLLLHRPRSQTVLI